MIALAAVRLAAAGIESPRAEARRLLAHLLGVERGGVAVDLALTPQQQRDFDALVARRAAHEPFAYIVGAKEFWSMEFEVGPGVLVPRPDTETLIERARSLPGPRRIADLGTGSGAILAAALRAFPQASGLGIDASEPALAYARRNLSRHGLDSRAELLPGDWNNIAGRFDLVFSNPPYIPAADIAGLDPEVRDHEPRAALDGGPDGLDAYRALARLLPAILVPGGHALLEIGAGQGPAMAGIFGPSGLELLEIAPDLAGIPRCVLLAAPG